MMASPMPRKNCWALLPSNFSRLSISRKAFPKYGQRHGIRQASRSIVKHAASRIRRISSVKQWKRTTNVARADSAIMCSGEVRLSTVRAL